MHPLRTFLLVLLALALIPAASASADTYTVDTTTDATDAQLIDGDPCFTGSACSLRAAIQQANITTGADLILLPSGTYNLSLTGGEGQNSNDLDITTQLTITGTGATPPVIDGNNLDRVFHIALGGNATIENVRVTGGIGMTTPNTMGGGILNQGTLLLRDSQIVANEPLAGVDGGGIANDASGTLTVQRTLIQGNLNNTSGSLGGGIYNNGGSVTVAGSTIDGNGAIDGAAIYGTTGTIPVINIVYSTITNNTNQGGAGVVVKGNGTNTATGSIISGNTGANNCAGPAFSTTSYNIDSSTSCGFNNTAQGDRSGTDPQLGPLADNGGQSLTRMPTSSGSPAVNTGPSAGCENFDQRGVGFVRPSGGLCDIGAVETGHQPPPPPPPPNTDPASVELDVAQVTRTPGDANTITATIRRADGSPVSGAQVRYSVVGANPVSGLLNADLAGRAVNGWPGVHDGADVYTVWIDRNGNAALDAGEPSDVATVNWVLPTPQVAKTVNIEPISGRVFVKLPANAKVAKKDAWAQAAQLSYIPLEEATNVPVGSIVDTRRGRVELTSSSSLKAPSKTQTAQFYSGTFQIGQIRAAHPVTEVKMTEQLTCPKPGSKVTASRARTRRLWGKGKGRFRTRGRNSSASVRGTTWYSKDDCKKTTTVVREGTVIVKDFGKKRNVRLTATGQSRYVARAKRR